MELFDTFIFVPAYNVENTLAAVLQKIPESVWGRSQVLVVDDGSKDRTGEVAKALMNCHNTNSLPEKFVGRLKYFRFEQNSGYGAVVKKGISEGIASGAKFVACLHGDGQYPADLLDVFLDRLEDFRDKDGATLALLQGSRHALAGGAKAGNMPLHKRVGGAFLTALENVVFKQKLSDRHSGFILYNVEFLKSVNLDKLSSSFDIDLELISIADARGVAMGELPIPTVYADEKSNLNVVSYGLRVLRQIWRRVLVR